MAAEQQAVVVVQHRRGKYRGLRRLLPDEFTVTRRYRVERPVDGARVDQLAVGAVQRAGEDGLAQAPAPEGFPFFGRDRDKPCVKCCADNAIGGGQGTCVKASVARLNLEKK